MQYVYGDMHLCQGIVIIVTSGIIQHGRWCSLRNHDWEQLDLGAKVSVSVEVMIITKGMTHVSFTGAPQWAPQYLSKSTGVNGIPKIVRITRGLSSFLRVRACLRQREALFGGGYDGKRWSARVRCEAIYLCILWCKL